MLIYAARKQPRTQRVDIAASQSTTPCPDSTEKTGALDTSLVALDRAHYQVGDEATFEVMLQNSGAVPIRIPFSPNLADLQPEDPAKQFAYYKLQILLWIAADERWSTNTGGYAALYGDDDHANTMSTLEPGQWIRIVAKGKIRLEKNVVELVRSGAPADHAYAAATLFLEEKKITARQSATVARELCIAQTHGQSVPIGLSIP